MAEEKKQAKKRGKYTKKARPPKKVTAWSEEQAEQFCGLMQAFNAIDDVCAVMDCDIADLDGLCSKAFGLTFAQAEKKFHAQGRALIRKTMYKSALDGNTKALDMLAREQLGLDPVKSRQTAFKEKKPDERLTL